MSKKDKELKKKKKKKDKKDKGMHGLQPISPRTRVPRIIEDDSLPLEERIYMIPFTSSFDFNQNRHYQLEKEGLLEKYKDQMILTTYEGGFHDTSNKYENYVGKVTKDIRETYLSKYKIHISDRSNAEYNPGLVQYVGASIVTSDKYVLVLESLAGRLKGKYTMVQGHVDYDSSYMYTAVEPFIAKNAYRELIEEVKFKDGTSLPVENMEVNPSFFINKSETLIDIEHIGFVYQYKLSDEDILKVVSAEPEKHDVVVILKEELKNEENTEKFDSWLSSIAPLIK